MELWVGYLVGGVNYLLKSSFYRGNWGCLWGLCVVCCIMRHVLIITSGWLTKDKMIRRVDPNSVWYCLYNLVNITWGLNGDSFAVTLIICGGLGRYVWIWYTRRLNAIRRFVLNEDNEIPRKQASEMPCFTPLQIYTLKEVQAIRIFAEDIKVFWHHFIMEPIEKFLFSQISSDDRFMGGLYTEIVMNNYG